jgi:hypothetical protein
MAKDAMKAGSKPQRARNKFLREKRQQAREQAKERQKAYDALTIEQKLAKLDKGGFTATKQRAKLDSQAKGATIPVKLVVVEEPIQAKEKKGQKAAKQAKKDKKGKKS